MSVPTVVPLMQPHASWHWCCPVPASVGILVKLATVCAASHVVPLSNDRLNSMAPLLLLSKRLHITKPTPLLLTAILQPDTTPPTSLFVPLAILCGRPGPLFTATICTGVFPLLTASNLVQHQNKFLAGVALIQGLSSNIQFVEDMHVLD